MKNCRHRSDCRLCGSTDFELVLPIRPSAIGDAFVPAAASNEIQDLYPLATYLCLECGHLQNLDIVDPEVLFRNYSYRTSSSTGLVSHFQQYARSVIQGLNIPAGSLVVEIGSNDGSLLKAYKALGMQVQGVDPAQSIAATASAEGVPTIADFFSTNVARDILAEKGHATLMCANNVFAHADNIEDIVRGIRSLLAPDGVFVFEVSYVLDMVDGMVFDTIYHEHLSHHSLTPLERFFNKLDMSLFDVERVATKGGSIRGFAQPVSSGSRPRTARLSAMFEEEQRRQVTQPALYRKFYQDIEAARHTVLEYVDHAIADGKMVVGYGASTTTTTLLYHFDLQSRLKFIVDDNPLKYGLYSPGAHLPVYTSEDLYKYRPDVIVILAWQYADAIMRRHTRFIEEGGQFLIPLPTMKLHPERSSKP